MVWGQFSVYLVPPFLSAALSGVLVVIAWRNRGKSVAWPFMWLMIAIGSWSLIYTVQLTFVDPTVQRYVFYVGAAIGGFVPVTWLVLTLEYSNRSGWLTPRRRTLLVAEPIVYSLLTFTNDAHGLLWQDFRMRSVGEFLILTQEFAPLYYAHLLLAYSFVLAGLGLLGLVFVESSRIYRRQSGLLIVGAVVPLSANVAFTLGVSPVPELDLTTATFTLTGVAFGFALFRFDLLDLEPVARRNMIEEFGDGVLILDDDKRVVEHNDAAEQFLQTTIEAGQSVSSVLPDSLSALDDSVIAITETGGRQFYAIQVSPLTDYREDTVGYLVGMRDVTSLKEHQQRLEVTNRLLRHNLRNEVTTVHGNASLLADRLAGEEAAMATRIQDAAERIRQLSDKSTHIETTLQRANEQSVVDATVVVKRAVRRVSADGATVELDVPETAPVVAVSDQLLEIAVSNLLENAVEHADGDQPWIGLSVETGDYETTITVADDGPGIPPIEQDVLAAEAETPLQHGSGLGLWIVHWIVASSGGSLSFEHRDPQGTVVTIALETADSDESAETTPSGPADSD